MDFPSLWVALSLLICSVALWKTVADRSRLRASFGFLLLWVALQLAGMAVSIWLPSVAVVDALLTALLALSMVQVVAVIVFDLLLRRMKIPKFASEIIIVVSYAAIVFNLLFVLGVNVTGIFATSAVAAAVVGLALQDMLSNIAGGIALELEGGVRAGDFVRFGDQAGWVKHVRLRHTAMETTDGDTIIVPNSQLTRSSVKVCGRPHRQFVPFSMSYAVNPQEVIDAVQFSLRNSPMQDIAVEPAPRCVIQAMTPGHIEFAAIVWLTRPGHDTLPVSAVLVRLYFALQRAGIPVAEITHMLETKMAAPTAKELLNQVEILRRTPILRLLDDPDLFELGSHLHYFVFGPGEFLIRQGDPGESMYFVISGVVTIVFRSPDGLDRKVAAMEAGDFFGEGSLLTGEMRTASAVAESRVECYRLDKAGLQSIMDRRPELAEDMSVVMAHRQTELAMVRERLDAETARAREAESQMQLLARIRRFFGATGIGAGK